MLKCLPLQSFQNNKFCKYNSNKNYNGTASFSSSQENKINDGNVQWDRFKDKDKLYKSFILGIAAIAVTTVLDLSKALIKDKPKKISDTFCSLGKRFDPILTAFIGLAATVVSYFLMGGGISNDNKN